MATANLIIKIRGGSSDRPEIELRPGAKADAFSVGSEGGWRINGPGISPVHAYLYFDGTTLFVCSAPGAVVTLGGAAVTSEWKPVTPPGEIVIGGVALDVHGSGGPATARQGSPGGTMIQPGAPGRAYDEIDDQPTQYQPMPDGFVDQRASPESLEDTRERRPDSEGEERTRVMQSPSEPEAAREPQRREPPREPSRPRQPKPERPERPPAPSIAGPGSGDGATVVKPLEQFLAEHQSAAQLPLVMSPDTAKRPLSPPTPAAGQPAQRPGGAIGVYIAPQDATAPPAHDGMHWGGGQAQGGYPGGPGGPGGYPGNQQQYPQQPGYGGYGQQQPYPQGPMQPQGQYPGMAGGPGAQGMMGGPGMPPGMQMQPGMQQSGMQMQPGMPPGMQMQPGMQPGMQQPGMYGSGMGPFPDQQQVPWGMQQMPTAQPAGGDDLLSKWKALPGPRKLMFIMLPFGLIAFLIVFASPQPGAEEATSKKRVGDAGAAAGDAGVTADAAAGTGAVPEAAVPETPIVPVGSGGAPVGSDAAQKPPPPESATSKSPPPPSSAAKEEPPAKLAKGQVTQERKAADAVASGDYAKALEIYEQLAKDHPEQPAYARAAEILRRRVKK